MGPSNLLRPKPFAMHGKWPLAMHGKGLLSEHMMGLL